MAHARTCEVRLTVATIHDVTLRHDKTSSINTHFLLRGRSFAELTIRQASITSKPQQLCK